VKRKLLVQISGASENQGYIRSVSLVVVSVIGFFIAANSQASDSLDVHVTKTSTCGCCVAWIKHLEKDGLTVTSDNVAMGKLMQFKTANGIGLPLAACHTAKVGGYTIEGHVPVREIRRLLTERPEATGLAVPGMPIGSPGMDQGSQREAYDVLLVRRDGTTEVYASYPASN
jgi:hypothetical protein